jgi:hypothetical protein
MSDQLRESGDENVNKLGYNIRCNVQIRAWCIVIDMEDQRGNIEELQMSEVLNPYEFNMFKTTWETFLKFQKWAFSRRRAGQEASQWGIIDIESGCDLLATHGSRGITLEKCDPGPIFPLDDPKFDEYLQKIWSRIKAPKIIIPEERELLELAVKIEEKAERGGGLDGGDNERGNRRGGRDRDREDTRRSRSRYKDQGDQDQDAPPRQSRRPIPPASDAGDQQEDAPPAATTAGPARRRAAAPAAEADTPPAAAPTRRAAPAAPPQAEEPPADEQAPAPPARRSAAAPAAPPPAARARATAPPPADTNGDSEDGGLAPARPPARRGGAPAQAGVDEEEDNAPEERHDPAPANRERPAETAEEPPPVGASAPAPRKSPASSDIKDRLARLNQRDRNQ